jgi:hypothetical protein
MKFELNYDAKSIEEFRIIAKALYSSKSDNFWGEYEGLSKDPFRFGLKFRYS